MKMLRDLASAMRRLPLPSGAAVVSPASLVQGSGITAATSRVNTILGPALDGHDYRAPPPGASVTPPPTLSSERDSAELPVVRPFPGGGGLRPVAHGEQEGLGTQPTVYQHNGARAGIFKAGQQHALWRNAYVAHAMPAVLQLQRHLAGGTLNQPTVRAQLSLEVRLFRDRMSKSDSDWSRVTDASYLLCTYLDEVISDAARSNAQIPYEGDRSLLVEYHGDAWGGEDAFADLERWMSLDRPPIDLLALYEMILSLGWQGRYRVRERGDILLQDLRSQLHALVWQGRPPEPLGTSLMLSPGFRPRWWTVSKAGIGVLALAAGVYIVATIDLDARGRPVREALAAWAPPVRTINLAETLPPPLPQLLTEGWLTAYKHPLGWLLVFKSDGAFDVGKSVVRTEFAHNIERLGLALAPWPGDLEVIGHTDIQPSRVRSNQALSEDRAETVAQQLRQTATLGGVRAPGKAISRQISFSGRGETEPVDAAQTPAAFERNRRVEVLWKVVPSGREQAARAIGADVVDIRAPANAASVGGVTR